MTNCDTRFETKPTSQFIFTTTIILSRIEAFFLLPRGLLCLLNFTPFPSVEVFGKMCFGPHSDIHVTLSHLEFFLLSVFETFTRIFALFLALAFPSVLHALTTFIFKKEFLFLTRRNRNFSHFFRPRLL